MTTVEKAAVWLGARLPLHPLRAIRDRSDLARSRRALGRLDAHLLRDIGLSPQDAEAEAARAIWDAPLHWRR